MPQQYHRIAGYDIARALAIMSMVFVNYRLALVSPDYQARHWFLWLTELFPCREAAMFVILAGFGTSLAAWRTTRNGRREPSWKQDGGWPNVGWCFWSWVV
jgi:uncharacterized protein